jgi:hypothetical protein
LALRSALRFGTTWSAWEEATMAGGYGRGVQGRLIDRVDAALAETPEVSHSSARHCFVDGEPVLCSADGSGGIRRELPLISFGTLQT